MFATVLGYSNDVGKTTSPISAFLKNRLQIEEHEEKMSNFFHRNQLFSHDAIITVSPTPPLPHSIPVLPPPHTVALPPPGGIIPAPASQSWCVAKAGAAQEALQLALDYACGVTDCTLIQPGGACYSPITLQNHASYAFSSYYHYKPLPTSCDFGGLATIVYINPSPSGSCVYPLYWLQTATMPVLPSIPVPPTLESPPLTGCSGSVDLGPTPDSISGSVVVRHSTSCLIVVTSLMVGKFIVHIILVDEWQI